MRGVVLCLMVSTLVAWMGGCAETGVACDPDDERLVEGSCLPRPTPCDEEPVTKTVAVGCALDLEIDDLARLAYFPWELTVEAIDPIRSGQPFRALASGVAKFDVVNLNYALLLFNELGVSPGFSRVAIEDFEATVRVRKGADGPDIPMELADLPKACTDDAIEQPVTECATDDECPGDARCLPVFDFKTSDNEEECRELGAFEAFDAVGFCITQADGPKINAILPLPEYTAHKTGSVLFGWADTTPDEKHPTVLSSGANRGAFDVDDMKDFAPNGFRLLFLPNTLPLPIQFECSMGTNSRSADGAGTVLPLLSPSPDGALISCPIEPD